MATVYHFPSICLTATKKLCSSSSFVSGTGTSLNVEELLLHPPPHHPITSCKSRLVVASSGKKSRTGKKSKVTRSTKSNADLCSELREFISMTGLPENSVPSMKVLSEHGRKDLANIVRRRGYKLIAELLMNTTEVDTNIEGNLIENHNACNINGNDSADGQEKRTDELQEDVLLSSKASILEEQLSSTKSDAPSGLDVKISESTGYLENSSLHEKASNFVWSGVLETIEGARSIEEMQMLNGSDVSYGSFDPAATDSVLGDAESENAVGIEATTGCQSTSISETVEGNVAPILDTGAMFPKRVVVLAEDHKPHRDDIFPSEEPNSPDVDQDQASKRDNQIEINCLKEMLQQKELELSQLKQQIEKEKLTLSILQSKGNAELGNAQKVVLAKDAELHAAEESLSSLKEVEIEYWGNGEIVEVAGSFNGWHHPILMDRHASSKAIDPTVLRNSILWYTVLWLYPGIYEIKFIVDGNWRIDPQKEFVTRGHIQNNILRVDR